MLFIRSQFQNFTYNPHLAMSENETSSKITAATKGIRSLFSWNTIKDLKNQSIKTKFNVAIIAVTLLANLIGALGIGAMASSGSKNLLGYAVILGSMLFSMGSAVMVMRFIRKTVLDPIQHLIEGSDKIAAGDFTIELSKDFDDEVGELVDYYNALLESVRQMMGMLSGEQAAAYMAAEENAEAKEYVDRKVHEMLEIMEKVAEGDLTQQLAIEKEDEIGELYKGFNKVVLNLSEILEKVRNSVEMVKSSGHLIKDASIQMREDASAQTQGTKHILESVEFLSATAQSISITSQQTMQSVQDGIDTTSSAEKEVGKTVNIMIEIAENAKQSATLITGLNESSEKIGEIVLLIKEIANQTNLLALNAAIEAARAGVHGKGFAVVAEEVKKLAERTAVSTSEISDRIVTIQEQTTEVTESIEEGLKRIEAGTEIAGEAQKSLEKVMENNEMGVQMVIQIDSSSEMQSESTKEIADTIKNIVNSIQSTENQVRGISNAALDLNQLTDSLEEAVSKFHLANYQPPTDMDSYSGQELSSLQHTSEEPVLVG